MNKSPRITIVPHACGGMACIRGPQLRGTDLLEGGDAAIWAEAQRQGAVLISKDEDFVHLRTTLADGPALIWVRIGNTTRRELLDGFTQLMPAIEAALMKGERIIEIAPPAAGRCG